ncbi:hypothetical protein BJQ94_15665 [Cryobacterium sp. SO2]|uniref:hypothetical protein n=1 Tax=Cryobacterium sp. SO2 TaxID=1897060 RepID=UPI00223E08FA|nr:hypothetical protein [Cryobacterium sp. SO2]WEO76777.1 hypothetical protein BJQ94_15665 [Cryobacterium sp. SO2]
MELVAAIVGVVLLAIILVRVRVTVMLFLVYNFAGAATGLALYARDGIAEWSTVIAYTACVVAILVGFVAGGYLRPAIKRVLPSRALPPMPQIFRMPDTAVSLVVWTVGLMALYHLIASGIPLFADSIEVERFDFTSSGFFGIPGRMYLYGVPLSWMLATASAQAHGYRWRDYPAWWVATGFYILTSLLSGFKSGLLAMAVTGIIAAIVITGARVKVGQLVARYWLLLCVPVVFGLLVATTYSSYQKSDVPLWRQLIDRVTLVGAEPKQFAIEHNVAGTLNTGVLSDFWYYIQKYTGADMTGQYSLERAVSAKIINANPASDAWTTPVTVGGFPELIFSFGLPIAIIVTLLVGIVLQLLHSRSINPLGLFLRAVTVYGIYTWLLKGGLAYYVINVSAVTVMVLGLLVIFTLLTQLVTSRTVPSGLRRFNDAVFAHRAGRGWNLPRLPRPTLKNGKHVLHRRTRH